MPRVSQLEALRQGKTIEDTKGVYAHLNPETKSIEYSTGEVAYVGNDPDYFPSSDVDRQTALEKEKLHKDIESFPLGKTAGEFAYQFGQKGAITGGIGDWVDRLTNTGDDYLAKRSAKQQVSEKISGERPYLSTGATVASFIPDIVATRGMTAAKAAPVLTTTAAGSRVLDEPGEVAGEAAFASGAGLLLDKGAQFLGRAAKRRGESRSVAREAKDVEARNIATQAEVDAENVARREAFQKQKEFVDRETQARQHQYNLARVSRENEMIEAKNAYEQAKAVQSAETEALKKEYQEAQRRHKEFLDRMPQEQRKAQKAISDRAAGYYDSITEEIPAKGTINTSGLRSEEFIDQSIRRSPLATTAEGRQASKVIRSLFEEGEEVGGKELARRLKVLDEVIETSPRQTQELLDQFKRFIGGNISEQMAAEIAYRESLPAIVSSLKADVREAFRGFKPPKSLGVSRADLLKTAEADAVKAINEMPKQEFLTKMRSGELFDEVVQKALPRDRFVKLDIKPSVMKELEKQGMTPYLKESVDYKNMVAAHDALSSRLMDRLDQSVASAELQASQKATQARRIASRRFREAYGLAEPVRAPAAPGEPVYPPMPQAPGTSPQVPPPSMPGAPAQPQMQQFAAEQVPELAAASGAAERMGDFLERPASEMIKGKGISNLGPIGNIAKMKYLLGGKALPLTGAYGLMKGLTSPTTVGQLTRDTLQRGGMRVVVETISSSYPSFENGVLQDPFDRKRAVAELESNPNIPIEDKAMLQAYINRGKSLDTLGR